jgi:hypothetical protein
MAHILSKIADSNLGASTTRKHIITDGTYLFVSSSQTGTTSTVKIVSFDGSAFAVLSTFSMPDAGGGYSINNADQMCLGPDGWIFLTSYQPGTSGYYWCKIWALQYDVDTGVFSGTYYVKAYKPSTGQQRSTGSCWYDGSFVYAAAGWSDTSDEVYSLTFDPSAGFTSLHDVDADYCLKANIVGRNGGGFVCGENKRIVAYEHNALTGFSLVGTYSLSDYASCLYFDGTNYYVGDDDKYLYVLSYDGSAFSLVETISHDDIVSTISDNGEYLFIAGLNAIGYAYKKSTLSKDYSYPSETIYAASYVSPYLAPNFITGLNSKNIAAFRLKLIAQFTASPLSGPAPLTVQFTAV